MLGANGDGCLIPGTPVEVAWTGSSFSGFHYFPFLCVYYPNMFNQRLAGGSLLPGF